MVAGIAGKGDSLGKISFEVKTGEWRELQKKWFDHWLKGQETKGDNAYCFKPVAMLGVTVHGRRRRQR
jgi:hypothetical protein